MTFGKFLKEKRLRANFGLRAFAAIVALQPTNLSALEHDRRKPPTDETKLREIAEKLGLQENTKDWATFFDLAREADELPADLRHMANRGLVPALLRTVDNRQLTNKEMEKLINEIASGRRPETA
jgi:transcriptional regulator with XRE-family HTH domain